MDHKLNLQAIVLFFALREWLFGKADLERKGVLESVVREGYRAEDLDLILPFPYLRLGTPP